MYFVSDRGISAITLVEVSINRNKWTSRKATSRLRLVQLFLITDTSSGVIPYLWVTAVRRCTCEKGPCEHCVEGSFSIALIGYFSSVRLNWSFMVRDEIYMWLNTVVLALNYHTCMRSASVKYRKNTEAKSEDYFHFSPPVSSVLFDVFWLDRIELGS